MRWGENISSKLEQETAIKKKKITIIKLNPRAFFRHALKSSKQNTLPVIELLKTELERTLRSSSLFLVKTKINHVYVSKSFLLQLFFF